MISQYYVTITETQLKKSLMKCIVVLRYQYTLYVVHVVADLAINQIGTIRFLTSFTCGMHKFLSEMSE